jgi:hypothetical protein
MFDYTLFQLVFWLIVAHALADFPLQGDYLAQTKNRHTELSKKLFNSGQGTLWPWHLFCHAAIHGGAVAYVTGSVALGCAEVVAHMGIDLLKNEGKIGYMTDQVLHIACKLLWAAITVSFVAH